MIALPLKTNSHTLGNFTIFSTVVNAFNDKEVELLSELAEDLAFGIETMRARAAHERKVRQLREEVESNTRKRVAAALHDGVAQSVQGVKLGLKRLRALATNGQLLSVDLFNLAPGVHRDFRMAFYFSDQPGNILSRIESLQGRQTILMPAAQRMTLFHYMGFEALIRDGNRGGQSGQSTPHD